jgi:hypothetical protein
VSPPEPTLPFTFRPRAEPLAPLAVAARGPAAAALAARLLARDDAALARLSGVAGPSLLIALGPEGALPWVNGVLYLGRDLRAPALLLPTAIEPTVPLPLLERALLARAPSAAVPLAVIVDAGALSLEVESAALAATGAARPIERSALRRWLEAERGQRPPTAARGQGC